MMAPEPAPEPVNEPEPEPVTDEERFLAADEDESGGLSIEELAEATGTDWKRPPVFMLRLMWTVMGRSRWKNSWAVKRRSRLCSPSPSTRGTGACTRWSAAQPSAAPAACAHASTPAHAAADACWRRMASATTQHFGRATTAQCLGPNAATRVGSAATPGLGSAGPNAQRASNHPLWLALPRVWCRHRRSVAFLSGVRDAESCHAVLITLRRRRLSRAEAHRPTRPMEPA
ncbi:MAG: hypothetical protein CM15mP128_2680 [Methanobacteriota archaeon]|nr:MAG: hypothetical protein CM15mP128_2680 [Euryarchaeota archaeon]